jgi:hypothetical protein
MAKTHLKLGTLTILGLIAILGIIATQPSCKAQTTTKPLVFLNPPTINGTAIGVGNKVNVTIMARDFQNLFMWQAGLRWDPAILNGVTIYADTEISDDVFDILAPGVQTMWNEGPFDNTKGTLGYSAQNLKGVNYGVNATSGVDYKFMIVEFQVKAAGISDIHLSDVILGVPSGGYVVGVENYILDTFTAHDGYTYTVNVLTNSTGQYYTNIYGHQLIVDTKTLSFNLTSVDTRDYATSTKGFCNVTIPKELMWVDDIAEWSVKVNNAAPLSLSVVSDAENYHVYFTYNHIGTLSAPGTLKIEITSTHVVPEFSSTLLLLSILIIAPIIALSKKLVTKHGPPK